MSLVLNNRVLEFKQAFQTYVFVFSFLQKQVFEKLVLASNDFVQEIHDLIKSCISRLKLIISYQRE